MKVYLSKPAEVKLKKIILYIEENWGTSIQNQFIEKLNAKIEQISKMPQSCPFSKVRRGLYQCVLSKQTTFYYRIKDNEIEIITFFDTRQSPDNLRKEI